MNKPSIQVIEYEVPDYLARNTRVKHKTSSSILKIIIDVNGETYNLIKNIYYCTPRMYIKSNVLL